MALFDRVSLLAAEIARRAAPAVAAARATLLPLEVARRATSVGTLARASLIQLEVAQRYPRVARVTLFAVEVASPNASPPSRQRSGVFGSCGMVGVKVDPLTGQQSSVFMFD